MITTTPRSKGSRAHAPESVPLVQYASGEIIALSLTKPGVTYQITLAPLGCECPAWQYRQRCCHTAAALARFGACYHCGDTEGVAVYTNGWDNGAEIMLCASCAGGR